jgi:putative transposase
MEFSEYYHIYNHSNGNENLFQCTENYKFFLKKYAQFIHPICKTYAYCLMPNHFHLLIKTRDIEEVKLLLKNEIEIDVLSKVISKQFSNFFNSYTQAFNMIYNRRGSLFMKNFKRKQVVSESYFVNLIQYIHSNPIHHGFVQSIEEWDWSSYQSLLSDKKSLLEREIVLEWFDGRDGFLKFHQQMNNKDLDQELEIF